MPLSSHAESLVVGCIGGSVQALALIWLCSLLIQLQPLERRRLDIVIKDRIDLVDLIGIDLEEAALVLTGDQGAAGAIVHGDLEGLHKGAGGFDVALNAHVTHHKHAGPGGGPADGREGGQEEGHANLSFNLVAQEVDGFDVVVVAVGLVANRECALVGL